MTHRIILRLTVTASLLLSFIPASSQLANTMYFMKGAPQVYQINPAFQSGCKFFIGLPGLSPLQLRVQNQPLTLSDIFYYNESIDQMISFLHPLGSKSDFFKALDDRNYVNTDVGVPLASIGFGSPSKGSFVAFDITQRVTTLFGYPGDLFKLPIYGPGSNSFFDFSGFGINLMAYTEFGANVSQKINDKITVGWRGKILLGQANLSTTKFDVTFETNEQEWAFKSNIVMDATLPFLDVFKNEEGMIDSAVMISDIGSNIPQLIFNPKNTGLAMDLGINVEAMDNLFLSASIVDFGSIRWKDKVYNLESKANYEFTGVEVTLDGIDPFDTMVDSLQERFNLSSTEDAYRTWLPTKIYLGGTYFVHPKISFGILSRSEIYKKDIRQQFTLSANLYPIRMISTSFSYSIIEGSYKNLGFGLALKAFPFNFYIITDTAPSIALWPYDASYLNLRIGMNIMFGCKQKKVVKYDMPLIN